MLIRSRKVVLEEITLYMPQLPDFMDGVRILQVGDLHTIGFGWNEEHLQAVIRQGCDMLIFTGDFCYQLGLGNPFYSQDQEPAQPGLSWRGLVIAPQVDRSVRVCRELLEDFNCPFGVFAVQGNHDPDEFITKLVELGVTVLANKTTQIANSEGGRFNLCGVRCYGRKTIDIAEAVLNILPSLFSIAICHYPEMAGLLSGAGIDLILAGHTHGGQICLPGGIPLVTHSRTGKKYAVGLERINSSVIYTTRGLGYSILPIRIFCPPEITRITLRPGDHTRTNINTISL